MSIEDLSKLIMSKKNGQKNNTESGNGKASISKGNTGKSKQSMLSWIEAVEAVDLSADNYEFEIIQIIETSSLAVANVNQIIYNGKVSDEIICISKEDIVKCLESGILFENIKLTVPSLASELLKSACNEIKMEEFSSEHLAGMIKILMIRYKEEYIANRAVIEKLQKQMEEELKKLQGGGKEKDKGKEKGKDVKDTKGKGQPRLEDLYEELHKNIDSDSVPSIPKEINLCSKEFFIPEQVAKTYFVLCHVYDNNVIRELSKLGLDVSMFIEVGTECRKDDVTESDPDGTEEYIREFWDVWANSYEICEVLPPSTCYVNYIPQEMLSHYENFENFKRILYNIQDFRRQYKNYFNNLRYLDVKETKMPIPLNCLKLYNALLSQVPNECITIPHLFNCLLEEVCTRIDKCPSSLEVEQRKIIKKVHGGPVHQIKTLLDKYDSKLKPIQANVNIPKTIHLRYGNTLEYITGSIKFGETIFNSTLCTLKRYAPLNLFDMFPIKDQVSNTILYKYLFYKWTNQVENVTEQELKQCVYSLLFSRKKFKPFPTSCNNPKPLNNLNSLMFCQGKPYNQNTVTNEPKINFNPYNSMLSQLKIDTIIISDNCLCQTNPTAINCGCQDILEQYCNLCEQMDSTTMAQVLTVSQNHYNHFDYKYFSPCDVILLRFHYYAERNGLKTVKCANSLRSVLCFRDFCIYVLTSDLDWFVKEENIYWDNKKIEEDLAEERKLLDMKSQITCDDNFIIPGSIKQSTMVGIENEKSKETKEKQDKAKSDKPKKDEKPVKPRASRVSYPTIPNTFLPYDPDKNYAFELYNLGSDQLQSREETTAFHSVDGISVYVHKQKWSSQNLFYSFNITSNDNNLIIHNILNKVLTSEYPFNFHVNVANGIVMAFSIPLSRNGNDTKHVITNKIQKQEPVDTIFSTSQKELPTTNSKNETIEYIKNAIREKIPVFKIVSSRLHKYQYVKRIKSRFEIPVGKLLKRVLCKPTLYLRLKRSKTMQESKCIPYTNFANQKLSPMYMMWKASLPTGLVAEVVPAVEPYDYYIKQKYIVYRPDLKGIKDELYRCFVRNGSVIKFLKDGTIMTYTSDKNICHYKYGCFSSNTRKKQTIEDEILSNLPKKQMNNIIPLHFYINDLSKIQKKIRKICKKYKKHLIDIADNYRFESSRLECRKLHKVYKLSKKLFIDKSYTIPLLNYTIISAEGKKIDVKNNIVYHHEKRYRQMEFNDYLLSETIIHREDGTSWLMNTNGTAVTQFTDGTRITTWCTELEDSLKCDSEADQNSTHSVTPSTDKHCQFDEASLYSNKSEVGNDIIDDEEDFSVLYPVETKTEDEGFVLVGMNYMFEHPNYATVTYFCHDNTSNIKLPDNTDVTIDKNGFYNVNLLSNDYINIYDNGLQYHGGSCCTCKTVCNLNVSPLIREDAEDSDVFLTMKDSSSRVFKVNYNGAIISYEDMNQIIPGKFCNIHTTIPNERCFILRRDLSGEEYYRKSIPYNFLHTLNKKNPTENKAEETFMLDETYCTTSIQSLRKSYTEHLMMLYDFPILATASEKCCIDKLWKLHDFDMNTVIFKRKPLYTFKRSINRLPINMISTMSKMLEQCLSGVFYNAPELGIVDDIPRVENVITAPVFKKPSKIFPLKSKTVNKLCEEYGKLIKSGEVPKYFQNLYGTMFTTVEECSEAALTESAGPIYPIKLKKEIVIEKPKVEKKVEGTVQDEQTYPGTLNVPKELTIHLKPDSYVHEIELTSVGLRIITEKSVQEYNFPNTPTAPKAPITPKASIIPIAPKASTIPIAPKASIIPTALTTPITPITPKNSQYSVDTKISVKSIPLSTGTTESKKKVTKKKPKRKRKVVSKAKSDTRKIKYKDMDDLYIGEIKSNVITACKTHMSLQNICKTGECVCEIQPKESIHKRILCNCTDVICHCPKSELKGSDTSSCYTPAETINFQKLALTTINYFSTNTLKFRILYSDMNHIIPSATQFTELTNSDTLNYVQVLKLHMHNYMKTNKNNKEYVLDILRSVKISSTSTSSKYSDKLNYFNLDEVISTVNLAIIDPKSGNTKGSKIDFVKEKFLEMNVTSFQQNKIIEHFKNISTSTKSSEEKFSLERAPQLFRTIINEINVIIESSEEYRSCCNTCTIGKVNNYNAICDSGSYHSESSKKNTTKRSCMDLQLQALTRQLMQQLIRKRYEKNLRSSSKKRNKTKKCKRHESSQNSTITKYMEVECRNLTVIPQNQNNLCVTRMENEYLSSPGAVLSYIESACRKCHPLRIGHM